jgi:site-specific recombinase XerD
MRKDSSRSLRGILEKYIDHLATVLRPNTIKAYRRATHHLLRYLAMDYPRLGSLSTLRRDPHILGWLRYLCEFDPPLKAETRLSYLICMRRLLQEVQLGGEHQMSEDLIRGEDLPPHDCHLPRPLSPEYDRRLQEALRQIDDIRSNGLLLLRATGLRIGELLDLPTDCIRHLGNDQWALHVPLGKLHTERFVPVDDETRVIHARIMLLRQKDAFTDTQHLIPPLSSQYNTYRALHRRLFQATKRAGCPARITPHQLRHTYATEMLRAGVSLPTLMKLLGHKTIEMTLRYVQITQTDLQHQYQLARHNLAAVHTMPELAVPEAPGTSQPLPLIARSLAALRHLMEMFRRQLSDPKARRKVYRLSNRLAKISAEVTRLTKS